MSRIIFIFCLLVAGLADAQTIVGNVGKDVQYTAPTNGTGSGIVSFISTNGLIGFWPLDDTNSSRSLDISGYAHNGFLTNSVTLSNGVVGNCYVLNSNWVGLPALGMTLSNATFAAWVFSTANQSNYSGIVYGRSNFGGPGLSISGGSGPTVNQLGYQWNGAEYTFNSGLILPTNIWALVGLCVTATNAQLYVMTNNVLSAATNTTAETAIAFTNTIEIGNDIALPNRFFKGRIDDVRIYSRPLSALEFGAIYTNGIYFHRTK